jgi:hypothetical protein
MESSTNNHSRPNLKERLFWDTKFDEIDWQKAARAVIERVLVRGNDEEYEELIRFYGREKIIQVLTKERCSIWEMRMDHVTAYFGLKKEDLSCYRWRQEHGYHWI